MEKNIEILKNRKDMQEYGIWKGMKARCYAPSFANCSYQKKGIRVCDEWRNDFPRFVNDMGLRPSSKHSIERIENDKDYEPSNCIWATQDVQAKNRGSFNDMYEHDGKALVLKDWAREFGIKYTTLHSRIHRYNMTFDDAIKASTDKRIEINGVKMLKKDWCKFVGINPGAPWNRVRKGYSKNNKEALEFYIKSKNIEVNDIVCSAWRHADES